MSTATLPTSLHTAAPTQLLNRATVTHSRHAVCVRVTDGINYDVTYTRAVRQRSGMAKAWSWAQAMAGHVQEVAAMVSTSALVDWLIDSGFRVQQ